MEPLHTRTALLYGAKAVARLRHAAVLVLGVGGVGSAAAEALVRGGVGQITLVDPDTVCPTNLNRQLHATTATLGQRKVAAMAQRCSIINPNCVVIQQPLSYTEETSDTLLAPPYDYVLDCIDTITAKVHLISATLARGYPIISAMGAANKVDPTLLRVDDISRTSRDRLARTVRKLLRQRGIERGVQVVYSLEEFHQLHTSAPETQGAARARVPLGSSPSIPPLFGFTMAGVVLNYLAGWTTPLEDQ